jgi:hypothetical protein
MEATRGTENSRKWMTTTAGVLNIVAGSVRLMAVIGLLIAIGVTGDALHFAGVGYWMPVNVLGILWAITLPLLVLGALALVGGVFALQRRRWGWALAGSVAAFFPFGLLGLLATIFTAMSKEEFES